MRAITLWCRYAVRAVTFSERVLASSEEDRVPETHDLALEAADALFEAFPGVRVLIRMDEGFPGGGTLDTFEALKIDYIARIRTNPVLNRMAEPQLERPGDLEAGEVRTVLMRLHTGRSTEAAQGAWFRWSPAGNGRWFHATSGSLPAWPGRRSTPRRC